MKFSKFCFTLATAVFAAGAFADAANVLISFSTTADTYADGTPVKDGEWYALCWSADDAFDGLTVDCNPVNPAEKVLILAPLAEGGRCPYMNFQIDSAKVPVGGNYFVYLLDTRDVRDVKDANPAGVDTIKDENGNVTRIVPAGVVNGSAEAKSFTASTSVASSIASTSATGGSVATGDWAAVQPKITAFEVKGAQVKITVAGMMKGLTYKVNMGKDLNEMETFAVEAPRTEDGKAFFIIDPDDARFFKVKAVAK